MSLPVPAGSPVSFPYLKRYRTGKKHKGIDYGVRRGTTVTAALTGKVWYATPDQGSNNGGWGGAYGGQVIIEGRAKDGKTYWVLTAHLSRVHVRTGQRVTAGQLIGLSGGRPGTWGAGNTTGDHVHFQVNKSKRWDDHVNPAPVLATGGAVVVGDKMDSDSYPPEGPAVGPHITWLGTQIDAWRKANGLKSLYKVGPGPKWGAIDQAGVKWFQQLQGWTGDDADGFVGPTTLKRLAATPKAIKPSDPPKPAKGEPPVTGKPVVAEPFEVATFNMKAPTLTKKGKRSRRWEHRRGAQVSVMKKVAADVWLLVETGSGAYLKWLDAAVKAIGLKRTPGGAKWREIYVNTEYKVPFSGLFYLKPEYNKDDKQAAWAVVEIPGREPILFTSFHLEYRSGRKPDAIRVGQIKSCDDQAKAKAKELGVKIVIHGGDTNSNNMVRQAMENRGYQVAYKAAKKKRNTAFATLNGWVKGKRGGHIDYIFVPKGLNILEWDQEANNVASDHNAISAVIV